MSCLDDLLEKKYNSINTHYTYFQSFYFQSLFLFISILCNDYSYFSLKFLLKHHPNKTLINLRAKRRRRTAHRSGQRGLHSTFSIASGKYTNLSLSLSHINGYLCDINSVSEFPFDREKINSVSGISGRDGSHVHVTSQTFGGFYVPTFNVNQTNQTEPNQFEITPSLLLLLFLSLRFPIR